MLCTGGTKIRGREVYSTQIADALLPWPLFCGQLQNIGGIGSVSEGIGQQSEALILKFQDINSKGKECGGSLRCSTHTFNNEL